MCYSEMRGIEWRKENRERINETRKFLDKQSSGSCGEDWQGDNPIVSIYAELKMEIFKLKEDLKRSELSKKYYQKKVNEHNTIFASQLGNPKLIEGLVSKMSDEEKKSVDDIYSSVDDAISAMEESLYEPSERGAGYAVSDDGMQTAAASLQDCIERNTKEKNND